MKDFLKDKWALLLVLCVFIACKIPHLSYAYYWDECWPYASAVNAMWHNGVSLMPNAIDTELSRGHPLLFHALAAGWMKVFGASHIATHSFSLLISVILLVSVYEIGTRLFNQRVGVMALLLVAMQEAFFVQSSFLLLEVQLALFCTLSLYFYVTGKWVLTAISLAAVFFTKESGMVLGIVLGIDSFVRLFNISEGRKTSFKRFLSIAAPCIAIVVFFLVQKQINGWYIFPGHADMIEHNWDNFWYKFRMACVMDIFCTNWKNYYFILLLVLAIVAAVKNRKIAMLIVFIPAYFIYYFVDNMRAGRILPSAPFFILFVIGWLSTIWVVGRMEGFRGQDRGRFVVLTSCFVLLFLCFSSMNFYTPRYMLAYMIPFFIVVAALLDYYISHSYKPLYYVSILIIAVISYVSWSTDDHYGDTNLGAFDGLYVQQSVVGEMERKGYYDKKIGAGSYLEKIHLTDPSTGFRNSNKVFSHVEWLIDTNTELAIFDNIENDVRYPDVKKDTAFQLTYRIQKGQVWAEIYKRK